MAGEGLWIEGADGEPQFIAYEDIDPELLPRLLKPIGGFCYQAQDFLQLPLPRVPFYIQDWLPKQGKAEIFGSAKSGKSYLAIQLARCIASGIPFLGKPTTPATVLYLQFELGAEILQARMRDTGLDYAGIFVGTTFSMKLDSAGGQEQLKRTMSAVEPKVLILDPFYKILRGDENESQDVGVILDFLDEVVIDAFGCSIVIIHHTGKDASKGGRGSSIHEGWADSCISVKRISNYGEPLRIRLMPQLLRHAETPPEPTEAELIDFEFVLSVPEETVMEKVRGYIESKADRICTMKEMIEASLGKRRSIYDALESLIVKGVVYKPKYGGYQWTPPKVE